VEGSDLLNTDDLPYLEYELPLCISSGRTENLKIMSLIEQSVLPRVSNLSDEQQREILLFEQSHAVFLQALIAAHEDRTDAAVKGLGEALQINPNNADAADLLDRFNRARAQQAPGLRPPGDGS
jgi:hypothetical protein